MSWGNWQDTQLALPPAIFSQCPSPLVPPTRNVSASDSLWWLFNYDDKQLKILILIGFGGDKIETKHTGICLWNQSLALFFRQACNAVWVSSNISHLSGAATPCFSASACRYRRCANDLCSTGKDWIFDLTGLKIHPLFIIQKAGMHWKL